MRTKRPLLGAVLLRQGVIDTDQLAAALAFHTTHRCRLGEALIKLGFCTDVAVMRAVAEQVEMPFVNLEEEVPPPRILQLIPRLVARQWGVVPVREEDGRVLVVARNPFDFRVDEAVRKAVGGPVTIAFGVDEQIEQVLDRYDSLKPWELKERHAPVMPVREDRYHLREWTADLGHTSDDPKIAEIVDEMIAEGLRRNASEVHFEPKQGALYVNARVDEEMAPLGAFPHSQIKPLIARVKHLCGLPAATSFQRQDGVYHLTHEGRSIEFKARTSPSLPHECIYLKRDIQASRLLPSLEELWFSQEHQASLACILQSPRGLILAAGPAGSGPAATLFSLAATDSSGRRVVTVTNGVCPELPGSQLVDYSRTLGSTAARAMRNALDLGAELMVVTDLPDFASIGAVFRAAENCLVLAALESSDVLESLLQFQEDGLPPLSFIPKVVGALTQRQARRVCERCAVDYEPDAECFLEWGEDLTSYQEATFRRGRGCERCLFRGYRGRVGVYELLEQSHLATLMSEEGLLTPRKPLLPPGWRTLRTDAAWKARVGLVCPEDIGHLGLQPQMAQSRQAVGAR